MNLWEVLNFFSKVAYKKELNKCQKKKKTDCILSHISDAMITNMKTTKSIYDDIHSNWATTINFSSSLQSYANEQISIEKPNSTSNLTFDHFMDCQKNRQFSNIDTVEHIQICSDPLQHRTISNLNVTTKNQRQFTCTYCPFSCTWFYDLKIHLRQKHKIRHISFDKQWLLIAFITEKTN